MHTWCSICYIYEREREAGPAISKFHCRWSTLNHAIAHIIHAPNMRLVHVPISGLLRHWPNCVAPTVLKNKQKLSAALFPFTTLQSFLKAVEGLTSCEALVAQTKTFRVCWGYTWFTRDCHTALGCWRCCSPLSLTLITFTDPSSLPVIWLLHLSKASGTGTGIQLSMHGWEKLAAKRTVCENSEPR